MPKPPLHVTALVDAGFRRVGCWESRDGRLHCGTEIPDEKGVYAFSIDGVVQYVGLASKSLAKRLNFYRTPGSTQTTNIRLNRLILDGIGSSEIAIHIATPADTNWNGLPVSFAEGLEAGLIDRFDLPWNQRGTNVARPARQVGNGPSSSGSTLSERVLVAIMGRPRRQPSAWSDCSSTRRWRRAGR